MGNRGTTRDKPKKTAISGDKFKENEDERLEKSGVDFITTDRGTNKISTKDTKTSKKPKYKGKIHGGRGTTTN